MGTETKKEAPKKNDNTGKELAVISTIITALKQFDVDTQKRILNTVSVYLDLDLTWEN